jgi:hypothetical protein
VYLRCGGFSRWRGDFGEYEQALFPANYCEEINVMTGLMNGDEEVARRHASPL